MNARHLLAIGLCGAALTCGGDRPTEPTGPSRLIKSAGDGQTGLAGQLLPQNLTVQVVDEAGSGVAGVWVRFTANGGTVSPDSVKSGATGIAQASWTMSLVAGSYTATATAASLAAVTFSCVVSSQNLGQATQTLGSAGGTITATTALGTVQLVVPPGALSASATFSVEVQPLAAGQLPAGLSAASPIVTVSSPAIQSDSLISLRIPRLRDASTATAFAISGVTGALVPAVLLSRDSGSVTLAFRMPFLSTITGSAPGRAPAGRQDLVQRFLLVFFGSQPSGGIDVTGFRPGVDDWEFANYGSVLAPAGFCLGKTASMAWYYTERRVAVQSPSLYNQFGGAIPNWNLGGDYDNRRGWRLASEVQLDQDKLFKRLIAEIGEDDELAWLELVNAIRATGRPQLLAVFRGNIFTGIFGHSLLAWKVDESTGQVWVADPNYPGRIRSEGDIKYDFSQHRFGQYVSYERADGTEYTYDRIVFWGLSADEWNQVGSRWTEFDNGTIGTVGSNTFPAVSLTQAQSGASIADGETITASTSSVTLDVPSGYAFTLATDAGQPVNNNAHEREQVLSVSAGRQTYGALILKPNGNGWDAVDFLMFSVFYAPQPAIDSVVPSAGPQSGNTAIRVVGRNFIAGATATIGGNPVTNLVTASSTSITGTTPTSTSAGAKDVVVTTAAGPSPPCAGCFTYFGTATQVSKVSGDSQTGTIGQPLPNPLVVKVTDVGNNPVSGVTVNWTVTAGGGSMNPPSSVTSSTGQAQATWTLGLVAGSNNNTATATSTALSGSPVTFTASAAGVPNKLAFTVEPTSTMSGAAINPAVVVAVQDVQGNTLTGSTTSITLAITNGSGAAGATLGGTLTRAAANGVASFNDLAIDRPGTGYTLTATADSLASATSVTFSITVTTAAIFPGEYFSCGTTATGAAYCWGSNGSGQLGNGTSTSSYLPVPVVGEHIFTALSVGLWHACGVTTGGEAYCWGSNSVGQLGNGSQYTTSSTPVLVTGPHDFTAISSGYGHTCGITTSGAAYCWGDNALGQLGNATTTLSAVPVAVWGSQSFKAISAGDGHTCAITISGSAYCWGGNQNGQLGVGSTSNYFQPTAVSTILQFTFITAGEVHTCALDASGAAYCWGNNALGALGSGSSASMSTTPVAVSGPSAFASISAGYYYTCGVDEAGAAYCWGRNLEGQLGNGSTADSSGTPALVAGGHIFGTVAAGRFVHTCGVTAEGVAYCWGDNFAGELGNGSTTNSSIPVAVLSNIRWGP
jgi:alpha-tubulin suppressor-like RCC1 family protein